MYPLNDKDLDRLSRDAAEQYDVEQSTSGWEHLEKRLNKELPLEDEKDRRRFLLWLTFIAVLTGGTLTWLLYNDTPGNNSLAKSTTVKETKQPGPETANDANTITIQPVTGNSNSAEKTGNVPGKTLSTNPVTDEATTEQITVNEPPVKPGNTQQPKIQSRTITGETIAGKENNNRPTQTAPVKNDVVKNKTGGKNNRTVTPVPQPVKRLNDEGVALKNKVNNKVETGKNDAGDNEITAANKTGKKDNNEAVDNKTANTVDQPVTAKVSGDKNETAVKAEKGENKAEEKTVTEEPAAKQPETDVTKTDKPQKPAGSKIKAPLEFGLVTGPDFSNVNFKYASKTGINLGLSVAYRFSDRFSVNSGFIYTRKFYKASGEDFHPPKHSWISYQDVYMVEGFCSMYEIPVNLRYDVSVKKQNRFFVSSGLSTYLMNNQSYDCNYKTNTGTMSSYKWSSDSSVNYLFSVLNISAGFEHNISKQLSIQAEPYLKVPLKGMGYGNMNLDSYGLYLTLKYKPFLKK